MQHIGGRANALCLCYVKKYFEDKNYILREDFLDFVPIYELTDRDLATVITNKLESHKLNMSYMCGQGNDGASSISSYLGRVHTINCEKFSQVKYVHCRSHSFNLTLSHACSVQPPFVHVESRWVERYNILISKNLYIPILPTLNILKESQNLETSAKSSQLLCAMGKSEFLVSLIATELFS
ncbi:hypothetical protein PR048_013676 [Dryococelus australis]|uniref:DUF4371 domain-containing protein n=1 Tax=Dryococelus australis TaxID=614101 RepID=A0ABQ9HSU9_9NEOP|nr:hypothetical protein PR048_013676 [Dryococelus australis]